VPSSSHSSTVPAVGLRVECVSVTFGERRILDDFSLTVDEGRTVALLGPSGSGKSTLLRVIAGLITPDSGTVSWGDVDLTSTATHRRSVGMVFQDEQLFPHMSVGANIEFGLKMANVASVERRVRVDELLELVGLNRFGPRRVTDLSGGEAKRVALARALAPRPRVLLLDEPLTGLDRDLHDRLAAEIREILHATATTAIHVTHDPQEAEIIADRIVHLTTIDHS
jgi:thiamine transport system ATP-binding protein